MVQAPSKSLTLAEFLQMPETEPANEHINGHIIQKPMPKGRHSRLQGKLCTTINQAAENARIAYAFPELRVSIEYEPASVGYRLRRNKLIASPCSGVIIIFSPTAITGLHNAGSA